MWSSSESWYTMAPNIMLIATRNLVIHTLYTHILKKIFFMQDPEDVHDRMTQTGVRLGSHSITRKVTSLLFNYQHPMLEQEVKGIHFPNPIGLAAGFDKNALLIDVLPSVGFGFAEVGSVTGEPCAGNPKPRLSRLIKSRSLNVYYGLKNDGCEAIASRLKDKRFPIPLGISVAKTNCEATCATLAGIEDYVKAYKAFDTIGSYMTINISCPNAFGGQPFTDRERLDMLLKEIAKLPKPKPVFLKLSPDLDQKAIDSIIQVARKYTVDGFIIANLTKKKQNNPLISDENVPEDGGLSGKVVEQQANELIEYVYRKTQGEFVIIGCGGVFSAEDAYTKIKLGASLIQMISGMIFEGPQVISEINRGLVKLLQEDGYASIGEAVGSGAQI